MKSARHSWLNDIDSTRYSWRKNLFNNASIIFQDQRQEEAITYRRGFFRDTIISQNSLYTIKRKNDSTAPNCMKQVSGTG